MQVRSHAEMVAPHEQESMQFGHETNASPVSLNSKDKVSKRL